MRELTYSLPKLPDSNTDSNLYPGIRSWPNRLLMEIECITDPDELEAACNLGLKRVALLRSGK